jgi:hypothetical protein
MTAERTEESTATVREMMMRGKNVEGGTTEPVKVPMVSGRRHRPIWLSAYVVPTATVSILSLAQTHLPSVQKLMPTANLARFFSKKKYFFQIFLISHMYNF